MSYRYLLFDLDDTLLDFKRAEATAIRRVLTQFGIDSSDRTVRLYSEINDGFWKRFERGEIERSEIFEGRFRALASQLGLQLDTAAVSAAYFRALSECGFVFPEAVPLLEQLKKGHILCAITNGALFTQTMRMISSGLGGYFSGGIYISEQIGLQKPQKEYFDYVLRCLGNPPKSEVLVLGDSPSSDIAGAKSAGLDSCFVNLRGQTIPATLCPTYTVCSLPDIPTVCGLHLSGLPPKGKLAPSGD